jgi:hypothetical protein
MLADYMGRGEDWDTGSQLDVANFNTLYPLYCFDVSKQAERLKDGITDIYVRAWFGGAPGNYRAYAVVQSARTLLLSSDGSRMSLAPGY